MASSRHYGKTNEPSKTEQPSLINNQRRANEMSLGEALRRYLTADTRGQLILKLCGEDHLCKISIDAGHAVYLSLGKLGPAEALKLLDGAQVEWINFIAGMPARKRLPHSLNKQLMEITLAAPSIITTPLLKKAPTAKTSKHHDLNLGAPPKTVESIIEDFIDLIGPLGTVLAEQAAQDLGYCEGSIMEPATLERFIEILAGEVPESKRQSFVDKHSLSETGQIQ